MTPPTGRSRGPGLAASAVLAILVCATPPRPVSAQGDTTRAPVVAPGLAIVARDTTRRVRPMGAFWRSLLLPGWGQAETGRPVTGVVFVAWEGMTAMMTLKAQQETHYLKETGSSNLGAKRQEVQDWLVLWIFNHLFSGAEAFVSAHLQDFPRELRVQAVPHGLGISLPVPRP
jgi:hypothetical protein